ncbi:hypothetical protein HK102_004041 [Quaeritorhiza haematococci]|nr:hypothetical protein HK102_004041 [Quaeritorhiza haematococci]
MPSWMKPSATAAVLAVLAAVAGVVVLAQNTQYDLYSNVKANIGFMKYTPAQRTLIANQAKNIFDIYVNRESKVQYYEVDPVPRIAELVEKAPTMSDKDFHLSMAELFLNLRDLHTNYYIPVPYACYRAIWPITFALIESDDLENNPQIAVKALSTFPQVLDLAPEIREKVQTGDLLVSYNGKTFKEYYEENKQWCGGANTFGGHNRCVAHMSLRSGRMFPLPEETEAVYVLRRGSYTYTVKAPIVMSYTRYCVDRFPVNGTVLEDNSDPAARFETEPPIPHKIQEKMLMYSDLDDLKNSFEASWGYERQTTEEPIISWSTYQRGPTNLGIIRLESFSPSASTADGSIRILRRLLVNELKDTDALVIDIRDNGGGLADFADSIPQLFVGGFKPTKARALISEINRQMFNTGNFNGTAWQTAYNNAPEGSIYAGTATFTTEANINKYGMAYFKPVAVWNNGNCYSACDIFSASMQDFQAGPIFGEDKQTGAGGANVVALNTYLADNLPVVFEKLPNGQDMRVSWRQIVRNGKNEGKLIEDLGVFADQTFRPTIADLKPDKTDYSPLRKIAFELKLLGRRSNKAFTSCKYFVNYLVSLHLRCG